MADIVLFPVGPLGIGYSAEPISPSGVTLGQDLKAGVQPTFILEDLRGILLVSKLIILVGSGFPMGPKQTMLD